MKEKATAPASFVLLLFLSLPCFPSGLENPVEIDPSASIVPAKQVFDKAFVVTSATYWTSAAMDIHSSRGKYEANPLTRNAQGEIAIGKNLAITGGIYALSVMVQKQHPRISNWIRIIGSGFKFTVAVGNYNGYWGTARR